MKTICITRFATAASVDLGNIFWEKPMNRFSKILLATMLLGALSVPSYARIWGVAVMNFSFTPAGLTIAPGDTVIWTNAQGTHSVHYLGSPAGLFGNSPGAAPWIYMFQFNVAAGVYNYDCGVHGTSMSGSITVQAPSAVNERGAALTQDFALDQNYPNPFNSRTNLQFSVPYETNVKITVWDVLGRQAAVAFAGRTAAGQHVVNFDAGGLAAGLYYYRLETPAAVITRKMLYIK
jgi:plastocyanin